MQSLCATVTLCSRSAQVTLYNSHAVQPHCATDTLYSVQSTYTVTIHTHSPQSPFTINLQSPYTVTIHNQPTVSLHCQHPQSTSTSTLRSPAFFFPKPLPSSPMLAVANTWFLCRPAELNRSPCRMHVPVLSARGM